MGEGLFREERTGVVGALTAAGGDGQARLQGVKGGCALPDRFPDTAFAYGIADTHQHAKLPSLTRTSMPE